MEEIRIAILDNNNSTLVFMDNTLPEALHYYNEELHSYLQGTTDMFSFTSPSDHPHAKYLKEGNKLAFRRKSGGSGAKWKHYYLNIMTVTQDEYEIQVESSGTMLELLNETIGPYKSNGAKTFAQYFSAFINDGGVLKLGVNDISDKTVRNEWTNTETVLARLYSLGTLFDAEISLEPKLNEDYSLKDIRVNVYEEHDDDVQGIGRDRTNEPALRYGKNIKTIRRKVDISDLYTAIRPLGTDDFSIAGTAYEELDSKGNVLYYSSTNNTEIYAPQAMEKYPSHVSANADQYILEVWNTDIKYESAKIKEQIKQLQELMAIAEKKDSDKNKIESTVEKLNDYIKGLGLTYDRNTDTLSMAISDIEDAASEYKTSLRDKLYRRGLSRLKKACKPKTTYEVDGYGNLDIGDTVMIIDESFEPELYLRARVVEQLISFTEPERNKTTFDNFTAFNSKISSSLIKLQEKMASTAETAEKAQTTATKAASTTILAKSTTASDTSAKVATIVSDIDNYEVKTGDKVTVQFKAENEAAAPTLSLEIGDTITEPAPILAFDGTEFDESVYSWEGDTAVDLVYNGEAWQMTDPAGYEAQHHSHYFWHDSDGAHVSTVDRNASQGKNVLINSDGMSIRSGTSVLASFEADKISLGNDSDSAEISLINGTGLITKEAGTNGLYITGLVNEDDPNAFWAGHILLYAQAADSAGNDAYIRIIGENPDPGPYGSGGRSVITLAADAAEIIAPLNIWSALSVADNAVIGDGSGTSNIKLRVKGKARFDNAIQINNTEAIDADGKALKAISDSAGNNIIATYMPISRGTVTDLNEALENGLYKYDNTASNKPNTAGGSVLALTYSSNYTYQIACPNNSSGSAVLYTRIKTANGWGNWTRNIGQQDIVHYVHEQAVASDTWTIDHNLGYFPSITVVDSSGNVVKGEAAYTSSNQVILSFAGGFAGKAYLN